MKTPPDPVLDIVANTAKNARKKNIESKLQENILNKIPKKNSEKKSFLKKNKMFPPGIIHSITST